MATTQVHRLIWQTGVDAMTTTKGGVAPAPTMVTTTLHVKEQAPEDLVVGVQAAATTATTHPLSVRFKVGHTADQCWHLFDEDHVPEEKHVASEVKSYSVDTNWYTDSGATDQI